MAIIYIAMLIYLWKVYAGPSELGSTDKVWMKLQMIAAEKNPVKWNNSLGRGRRCSLREDPRGWEWCGGWGGDEVWEDLPLHR